MYEKLIEALQERIDEEAALAHTMRGLPNEISVQEGFAGGLAAALDVIKDWVEHQPITKVYIAIGPLGWGKGFTVSQAKQLARQHCKLIKGGQLLDVFETTDPTVCVDNFGVVYANSPLIRIEGNGDFYLLREDHKQEAKAS